MKREIHLAVVMVGQSHGPPHGNRMFLILHWDCDVAAESQSWIGLGPKSCGFCSHLLLEPDLEKYLNFFEHKQ